MPDGVLTRDVVAAQFAHIPLSSSVWSDQRWQQFCIGSGGGLFGGAAS